MSNTAPIIEAITEAAINLVPTITRWIREGLSDQEIEARLRDPASVGSRLIRESVERQQIGKDLLGRPPKV